MTVTAQAPINSYIYAGSNSFVYSFQILQASDLVVTVGGITKTLGSDYTISGVGQAGGGSVVYLGVLSAGQVIVLYRQTLRTRATDYQNQGDLLSATVNADFDRIWMALQEDGISIAGALRVPEVTGVTTLPTAAARAGGLLGFDSLGNPAIVVSLPVGSFTFGVPYVNRWTADGSSAYALTANPGLLANLEVTVGGVDQISGVDYTWSSGAPLSLVPIVAWPAGETIQCRYTVPLPIGTSSEQITTVQRALSGAASTTQSAINAANVIDVGPNFGMVTGRGKSGAQRIANYTAWMAANAAAALVKGQLRLPAGDIEIDCGAGALKPSTGVEWWGHGTLVTNIWDYTNVAGPTLDLMNAGVGSPPADRTITCVGMMTFWGDNAHAGREGMQWGRNYRSSPLTRSLSIQNYGGHGVALRANCWDVSHDHLQVAGCGTRTNNTSGVYMDSSVTDANDVTFICPKIEGNGSTTSAAGDWNIQGPIGGTNRGWLITGGVTEGGAGTVEALFANIHALSLVGHSLERTDITGRSIGFEFDACDGIISGGTYSGQTTTYDMVTTNLNSVLTFVWTTESPAQKLAVTSAVQVGSTVVGTGIPAGATVISVQPSVGFSISTLATAGGTANMRYSTCLYGLQFKGGTFALAAPKLAGWIGAQIDNQGARLSTLGVAKTMTFRGDATAQWLGEYCPKASVHLNSVNQTGVLTGVFTKVAFSTAAYDRTGLFTAATSRFTPQTLEPIRFAGCVTVNAMVDQTGLIVSLYRNGASTKNVTITASGIGPISVPFSVDVECTSTTDYFEIFVRQSSGATQVISGQPNETYCMVSLV